MQSIDSYSYHCGAIDALNQTVADGTNALVFGLITADRSERDSYLEYVKESCRKLGTSYFVEDDPLVTDLFPLSMLAGKFLILFYKADHVIHEYNRLKERKESTVKSGAYFSCNRNRLALDFGRLLSLPEDIIQERLKQNTEK